MQHNPEAALCILLIPPALIDHGLLTATIGKGHVPHPKRNVAFNQRRTSTAINLPPTLEPKPTILREILVMTDEIGKRALSRGPKSLLASGQGWLKQNRP